MMAFQKGNKHGAKNDKKPADVVKHSETYQSQVQPTIEAPEATVGLEKGTGEMPDKPLKKSVAEMMYYAQMGVDTPFDNESEDVKKVYLSWSQHCLVALDKMNLMVVPKRDLIAERLKNKELIMDVITKFLTAMTAPKDLQRTFPIEELTIRIIEGRTI